MEEQKENGKYFHYENIFKSGLTTLIGLVLMCLAAYGFLWVAPFGEGSKNIPWPVALGMFGLGFMVCFMRDALPGFITKWINKKTD